MGDKVTVFGTLDELSHAAAAEVVTQARAAITARGRFTLALSGGRTPKELYRLLASAYREQIDWQRVHLFWGDERYVPHDHPQSSYLMAREALLEKVPLPVEQIHPMVTTFAQPEEAARSYEETLRRSFGAGVPQFDLILLGMGADGHTASIFPGTPAVGERERLVVAVAAKVEPPDRLSLTLPVLAGARRVLFLATGADKQGVLKEVLTDPKSAGERYPAALVYLEGNAHWFVDQAAAGE